MLMPFSSKIQQKTCSGGGGDGLGHGKRLLKGGKKSKKVNYKQFGFGDNQVQILNLISQAQIDFRRMYERDYEVKKSSKVYISNLKEDTSEDDLRKAFGKFGPIQSISLKQKNDFTFAFVEFDAVGEAENAINQLDGKSLNGNELKVKFAHGGNDRRGGFQDRGRGRSFGGDREGGYRGRGGFDGPRRDFGDRPRGCFNCGEEGHMIKDCPKPRKPREGGFERRPYDGNRQGGERRSYGGDSRGGYDRSENRGYRGREGGDRRDNRRDQRSRSRSGEKKGGRRQRSDSS